METNQVCSLEERIRQLEDQLEHTDDLTSTDLLDDLEGEVARVSARVTQSNNKVCDLVHMI